MAGKQEISNSRLILGGVILVIGFLSPLLIPLVTLTQWSVGVKGTVSGFLALGIPEIFMLIAVAVLGKQGYEFLKSKVFRFLKRFAPADAVSLVRYRIGLFMFCLPLVLGWALPYASHYLSFLKVAPLWFYIMGDLMFLASFFVLGGNFWDKFSGLFSHHVWVTR